MCRKSAALPNVMSHQVEVHPEQGGNNHFGLGNFTESKHFLCYSCQYICRSSFAVHMFKFTFLSRVFLQDIFMKCCLLHISIIAFKLSCQCRLLKQVTCALKLDSDSKTATKNTHTKSRPLIFNSSTVFTFTHFVIISHIYKMLPQKQTDILQSFQLESNPLLLSPRPGLTNLSG